MTSRLFSFLALALLCGCAGFPMRAPDAAAQACAATAAREPGDARIRLAVDEARRQHRLFGGQTLERNGGMFRVGQHESAWSRPAGAAGPAWQRVAQFWWAVPGRQALGVMTSAGRVPLAQLAAPPAEVAEAPGPAELAAREALLRAAMADTPWSAAFISHLMKTAGFTADEFAFSDSHSDYVRAALAASQAEAAGLEAAHAFRACDVATTHPRAGDLLCATRASTADTRSFDALAAALAARSPYQGFPMHCDLVVHSGEGGDASLDVVGGNVIHSVTLARLALNARGVLSKRYIGGASPRAACAPGEPPCRGHLSRRPWVVLLQFRD